MGLFDKLFGKPEKSDGTPKPNFDTAQPVKTAEMLNEEKFWQIVDKSLKSTKNQDDQEQFLISEIEKLTPQEMIGFRLRTDYLLYETYNSEMWCAGYIMNGGCSDDSFEYFRCWVISRGKDTYYKTKANPDYLVNEVVDGGGFYDFESFWYVALQAFEKKTGKELYDYIDHKNFKTTEGHYPGFEFTWQEEDPASRRKICPNLYEKFKD
ncbi:MAG TPA: DUF4240 domain-containing protein [Chryseolinea sp.]